MTLGCWAPVGSWACCEDCLACRLEVCLGSGQRPQEALESSSRPGSKRLSIAGESRHLLGKGNSERPGA